MVARLGVANGTSRNSSIVMAEGVIGSVYCWDRLSMGRWQQSLAGGDLFSLREVLWMWLVELGVTVYSNNFCLGTPV